MSIFFFTVGHHVSHLVSHLVGHLVYLQLTIVPCFVGALHTGWLFRNQYKTMAFHDDDNDWVSRWMPLLFVCWHRTQEASRFSSLLHSSLLHTFLLHSTQVHAAHYCTLAYCKAHCKRLIYIALHSVAVMSNCTLWRRCTHVVEREVSGLLVAALLRSLPQRDQN